MSAEQHTRAGTAGLEAPWKAERDMFGALHVYDKGGDRLTNDRMSGAQGWAKKARLIAAAPDMLAALRLFAKRAENIPDETDDAEWLDGENSLQAGAYRRAAAAIALAEGGGE